MRKAIDHTGEWFGDLEVLRPAEPAASGRLQWVCLCHLCGKECVKLAKHLRESDPLCPRDCGCRRKPDLTGKTFGALTVLRRDGVYSNGSAAYICRCNLCGSEKRYPSANIKRGQKSCGCVKFTPAIMKKISAKGVEKSIVDGVHIYNALDAGPTSTSKTGVRGVYLISQTGLYRASCQVHGERWLKDGFTTIEEAKAAREIAHNQLLQKYGVSANLLHDSDESVDPYASALIPPPTRNSKTGVRGVYWFPANKCYFATCRVCGENWIKFGFKSVEEAAEARALAYDQLIRKHKVLISADKDAKDKLPFRSNAKDHTGEWYGDLEVLRPADRDEKGMIQWVCFCHRCGKECIKHSRDLKPSRASGNCGCVKKRNK